MRAKSFLFLVLLLLVRFQIHTALTHATPETIVKIEPYSSSANLGETFTINVSVINVQNLYSVEIALHWNSSALEATNIDVRVAKSDGVLYSPIFTVEDTLVQKEGKYLYAATSTTPAPSFNGSGNIVRITFKVTDFGNSTLNLESQLYDYPPPDRWPRISLPIDHSTIDGSFTIVPEFPNNIILLFVAVTALLAIIISKRTFQRKSRLRTSGLPDKIY